MIRLAVVVLVIFSVHVAQAADSCDVKLALALPAEKEVDTGRLFVPATINGQRVQLLVDTAGAWSLLGRPVAERLGLPGRHGGGFEDAAGRRMGEYVRVESMTLGDVPFTTAVEFLVAGDTDGGTLGLNFFKGFDLEIDNARSRVLLHRHYLCDDAPVYWTNQMVEFPFSYVRKVPVTTAIVEGKKVRAAIDTGSSDTFMDLGAARRLFGLSPDTPGVTPIGDVESATGTKSSGYSYRFRTLSVSGIAFENVDVVLTEDESTDLILGMKQLRHLRLYFAFDQRKIYATPADAK